MDPAAMLQGRTRETAIRRDAQGRWFNGPDPLTHPNLVRCFDAWLQLAPDGRFCLSNDINWAYVAIDGPAHFVRSVHVSRDQVQLLLSTGKSEVLDPGSLRQGPDGALYCDVEGGTLTARFDNAATTALSGLLGEDDEGVYIAMGETRIRPPVTDTPIR